MSLLGRMVGMRASSSKPKNPRAIFQFHDGARDRWIDPVEAWSKMEDHCKGDWTDLLRTLRMKLPAAPPDTDVGTIERDFATKQSQAAQQLAAAVSEAFEVPALSDADGTPTGMTRSERIALAARFESYLAGVAERARPFATSQPSTG